MSPGPTPEIIINTSHLRRRLPVAAAALTVLSLPMLGAPATTSASAAPPPATTDTFAPGDLIREQPHASRAYRPARAADIKPRAAVKTVERKQRPAGKAKRPVKRTAAAEQRHTVKRKVTKKIQNRKKTRVVRRTSAARGGAAIVAYARAQIGKPYVFGALDCSGLVLRAYKRIGVSLPHKASRQDDRGRRISRSAAKPGDLVFWGGDSAYHVAIYIGGGKVIHAPGRGRHVKAASLWGSHYFVRISR